MDQNTAFVSHRAQVAVFEYTILLFAASILFFAILNFHLPKLSLNYEVYSCLMSSYYGSIICEFPKPVKVVGKGSKVIINDVSFSVPYSSGNCYSNRIKFDRGEISCLTR